jgi:hypothetical protein
VSKENWIGYATVPPAFQFLEMTGQIAYRQQGLEIIERFGVNGSGVRKTGKRGRPFEIITLNYELSFADARDKLIEYKTFVGDDPVKLMKWGVDSGRFLVLSVEEKDCHAILNPLGGLYGDEQCCQVVSWTFLG